MNNNIRLVDRDYIVIREIDRWRVITSKQIKELAQFSSQRTCDRRLKKLVDTGYLSREKILYGIPYLYSLTNRGKNLIGRNKHIDKIKIEQIQHDLSVLNTAIFFHQKHNIPFSNMVTEKQLHSLNGFSNRQHQPDFIFQHEKKTICVEVELTLKAKDRLLKNIQTNFLNYDLQIWVVPNIQTKIASILEEQKTAYPNIKIIELSEVM